MCILMETWKTKQGRCVLLKKGYYCLFWTTEYQGLPKHKAVDITPDLKSIMPSETPIQDLLITHCSDVIMTTMASQFTSLKVVYSIVYADADQRKKSKFRVTGLCAGNSLVIGEFAAQSTSNA